ncbi:MAG: hypothetical protein Q8N60_02695, partial [Candidatus Diapherotrites archaeon]|nr:hypothetical protein [Candidatus Diapherotrites archaeon]
IIALIIVLIIAAVLFLWQAILFTAVTLAAIVVIILIAMKIKYRRPSLKELQAQKNQLMAAIKIAEQRYFQRKLSEQDFSKIFKEKQQQLIKIEALIDQQYSKEKGAALSDELRNVDAKKRHILQGLLEEKKRIVKEMDIAEKRYLQRKIDSATYQALVQKNQEKLIEAEAQIKQLYTEGGVQKVMQGLKQQLHGMEQEKKKQKKEREKSEKEKELEIAAEIAQQIMEK